jgi:hypothetical protein
MQVADAGETVAAVVSSVTVRMAPLPRDTSSEHRPELCHGLHGTYQARSAYV